MSSVDREIPAGLQGGSGRGSSLPRLLQRFWAWIVGLTAFAWATTWFFVRVLKLRAYPFSSPLFQSFSYQFDYNCYSKRMKYFHQARFFNVPGTQAFSYPALLALVYKFFYLFGKYGHPLFIATLIAAFSVGAALFARALIRRGIAQVTAFGFAAAVLITSYPAALTLYLANMEGIVWIATVLAMWAYAKDKIWTAAVLIAIAGAMKIYPMLYAGIFLPRKQYRQFALAIAVWIVINLVSLSVLGPTLPIAYHGLREGLMGFQQEYIYQFHLAESSMDHSLFGMLKLPILKLHLIQLLPLLSKFYLALGAVFGITLYVARMRHLPPTNLILGLTIVSILLPPTSHDYTLLHLYAPWAMLTLYVIDHRGELAHPKAITWAMVCFVALFTPENCLILRHLRVAGQFKCLTLVVLLVIVLRYPFEVSQRSDLSVALPE